MVGQIGNGKSSSGNTIFGKDVFKNDGGFRSITKRCKRVTKQVEGIPMVVIDTPGIFHTQLDKQATRTEILRCLGLASAGIHACLLVLSVFPFRNEDSNANDELEDMFGEKIFDYTILIFTKLDETNFTIEDIKKAVQSKSGNTPKELLKLVERCNNRFIVFNNSNTVNEDERKNAVVSLIDMIKVMDKEASFPYYTHEMFAVPEQFFSTKSRILRIPNDSALVEQMQKMEIGRLQTIKENEEIKREVAIVEAKMAELNERLEAVLNKKRDCFIM